MAERSSGKTIRDYVDTVFRCLRRVPEGVVDETHFEQLKFCLARFCEDPVAIEELLRRDCGAVMKAALEHTDLRLQSVGLHFLASWLASPFVPSSEATPMAAYLPYVTSATSSDSVFMRNSALQSVQVLTSSEQPCVHTWLQTQFSQLVSLALSHARHPSCAVVSTSASLLASLFAVSDTLGVAIPRDAGRELSLLAEAMASREARLFPLDMVHCLLAGRRNSDNVCREVLRTLGLRHVVLSLLLDEDRLVRQRAIEVVSKAVEKGQLLPLAASGLEELLSALAEHGARRPAAALCAMELLASLPPPAVSREWLLPALHAALHLLGGELPRPAMAGLWATLVAMVQCNSRLRQQFVMQVIGLVQRAGGVPANGEWLALSAWPDVAERILSRPDTAGEGLVRTTLGCLYRLPATFWTGVASRRALHAGVAQVVRAGSPRSWVSGGLLALGRLAAAAGGPPLPYDRVLDAVADPRWEVRDSALECLSALATARPPPSGLLAAVTTAKGDPAIHPAVLSRLDDAEPFVRAAAVKAVGDVILLYVHEHGGQWHEAPVPWAAVEQLAGDSEAVVRRAFVEVLRAWTEAAPRLVAGLGRHHAAWGQGSVARLGHDPDWEVKLGMLRWLLAMAKNVELQHTFFEWHGPAVLHSALSDEDSVVKEQAARVVGELLQTTLMPVLREHLPTNTDLLLQRAYENSESESHGVYARSIAALVQDVDLTTPDCY